MTMPPRIVKCPQCGASLPWSVESKWRPFCSERCKTLDLGAWAAERYRIPVTRAPDEQDSLPDDASPEER